MCSISTAGNPRKIAEKKVVKKPANAGFFLGQSVYNWGMNKTVAFLAVVVVAGLLLFFFFTGKKTDYVAPEVMNPVSEIDKTPVQTMPAGVQGEFGDEAVEETPKVPTAPAPKLISVSGNYFYSEDTKSEFAGKICFEPSAQTVGVGKRFCFDNADEVFAIIGIQKGFTDGKLQCTQTGPATVTVKNYTKLTGDAGGYDSATLTKFADTGNSSYLACGKY